MSKFKAAIYARFLTGMQRDESIEDQERLCREYAARNDNEIVAVYADRVTSGASMMRPGI